MSKFKYYIVDISQEEITGTNDLVTAEAIENEDIFIIDISTDTILSTGEAIETEPDPDEE